jgi:DNA helicase-2/ATP-dependent DNA helicase PcrA
MTRAKQHLALLVPQKFHVTQQSKYGDRHLYGSLTRFIPPEVAKHFDAVGPAAPAIDATAVTPLPAIDLMARVRRAF